MIGYDAKRKWLKERLKEGHVFYKLDVAGRVFIEYAPLEKSWVPIIGKNYMYIYCLWVGSDFQRNGYGKKLLECAIQESKEKGMNGICTMAVKKKVSFFSVDEIYKKYGFQVIDQIGPYELLALSFNQEDLPKFYENARKMSINDKKPTIYYLPQCPFVIQGVRMIEDYAKKHHKDVVIKEVTSLKEAKQMPCVFQNWANFINGKHYHHYLLNPKMLDSIFDK